MGAVYRARDLHFPNVNKLVAVKEMNNLTGDPAARETSRAIFEREANLLATLSHPAIPRVFDYFSQQDRSYLILEYILGNNLERILSEAEGFLAVGQVMQWAIEICEVLEYLHNHKPEAIIFRDLKPSNIMVNQHQRVVLVDFGIAKALASAQTGGKGTMIGTEGYSPPEQYRGEATAQGDIYALGASLHHLLTGRDPRLEAPFSFSERPVCQINPAVPPDLEAIIIKSLQYNPEDRYQNAAELSSALSGMLDPISPPAMVRSSASRQEIKPIWTFTAEDEIRGTAACEKGILYFGSYDRHLYAINASTGKTLWKYGTDGGVVSKPAIVADNLCFGCEDHRLHVISARTGGVLWTYFTAAPIRSSPRVTDGHVFIGSDDGSLHAINLMSGRRAWQTESGAAIRSTPLVLNDAIFFGNEAGDFFCLDYRGVVRWRFNARRALTSSPAAAQDQVCFASLDGNLYALDANAGWLTWRFRLGKGSISTPAYQDGQVYIGSIDGLVTCIEARNAREIWHFATEHQVTGSPLVYQGAVYCGSVDGRLYCLDASTGELRWKFTSGGPITGTPVVWGDIIYIGSTDHHLYALPA
jgi:outer membrane protein assembly factor BamB